MAQTILLVVILALTTQYANAAVVQAGKIVVHKVGVDRPLNTFAGIMDAFEDVQKCCPIPMLLNRSSTTCAASVKGMTLSVSRGYFSTLQNIYERDRTTNGVPFMCFMDCLFNSLDLIADTTPSTGGTLDVANITAHFETTVNNATWMDAINNATAFCAPKVQALTTQTTVRNAAGRTCSTLPLHFMFCLRRQLFMNCPSPSTSTTCVNNMKALGRRGVFMGLHNIFTENRRTGFKIISIP